VAGCAEDCGTADAGTALSVDDFFFCLGSFGSFGGFLLLLFVAFGVLAGAGVDCVAAG
jgi:hypothetical protein